MCWDLVSAGGVVMFALLSGAYLFSVPSQEVVTDSLRSYVYACLDLICDLFNLKAKHLMFGSEVAFLLCNIQFLEEDWIRA